MKIWAKIGVVISLSFMCLFTSLGYAVLSDTLGIRGEAKTDIPSGLFITSVTTDSTSNIGNNSVSFLPYSTTIDSTISRSRNTGTVTYNVTVLNNTTLTYSYRGIYYQTNLSGYNGNDYVSTTNNRSRIGVVCSLANAPRILREDNFFCAILHHKNGYIY